MKITDIIAHPLSHPLETPFYFAQGWVHSRSALIVEITTDEGITGWGESLCHGLQPPQIGAAFIENVFKPIVLNRDPFDVLHREWVQCLQAEDWFWAGRRYPHHPVNQGGGGRRNSDHG